MYCSRTEELVEGIVAEDEEQVEIVELGFGRVGSAIVKRNKACSLREKKKLL